MNKGEWPDHTRDKRKTNLLEPRGLTCIPRRESLIEEKGIHSDHIHPSELDLTKVNCPRCGYRTSGYFLDQVSGSYNFFCSCCRYEWEY